MTRPRVLHVIDSLHGGGAERVLITLLRGLSARRWPQAVCLLADDGPLRPFVPPSVPIYGRGLPSSVAAATRTFTPDVIQSWVDDGAIQAAPVAAARGIPFVHRIPNIPSAQYALHPRGQAHRRALTHALRSASLVIALSDTAADDAAAFFGLPRPEVVLNGYPLAGARAARGTTRPWPRGAARIAAVGRLAQEKGHRFLLDAIARLRASHPHVHCRIAGVGPLEGALRQQLVERGLEAAVELAGFHEDVWSLVRGADVFVMPSLSEGFGNALVEAMREGHAIVASDLPVFRRDVLGGADAAILVPPADDEALAAAIAGLLDAPANRRALGRRARAAAARFDVDRMVEAFAHVYRRLAAEGAHAAA
ncbi:MAG: glycosyltransferase [Acidobacteriota bacterium]